jgi:hypothetical protein
MERAAERPDNGYIDLIEAVLYRAVQDAQGHCALGGYLGERDKLQADALRWLADEQHVRDLVELTGVESEAIVQRVRRIVEEHNAEGAQG